MNLISHRRQIECRTHTALPVSADFDTSADGDESIAKWVRSSRFAAAIFCQFVVASALGQGSLISHTVQISNDADDGYYNQYDGSGWHADSQYGSADLVGSWGGITEAWVVGYRFPSTGIDSGDAIRSAYLELVSSDAYATSVTCGSAPCSASNSTFRVYGVAQDDGPSFSNTSGNTPISVPYTTSYVDYTTTGPGDEHGSCQGNNNGQNTCTHIIDVTNIVKEITSRPGWTSTSAMRFVMLSTDSSAPNVYSGYEDYSANSAKAATLVVNPPQPTIVSSGGWGTEAAITYPTSYALGPFVYPGASTAFIFLGDYYNFYGQAISQPTVTDNCGNTWNILAGPTDYIGISYYMRATIYYVQNPASCPAGDTITVDVPVEEPIFFLFLAVAGSNTAQVPLASAITSSPSGTYTTTATTDSLTITGVGQLLSWIFGDSDNPHTFTPQAGFTADANSIPTYLTEASENASTGTYTNTFSISPSDGWETLLVDVPAASGTVTTPMVTVTASPTTIGQSQPLTMTVSVSGSPTPTGSVSLAGGGYTSGSAPLTDGSATIDIHGESLNLGVDAITATYTPDSNSSSIYSSSTGTTSVTVVNATPAAMTSPSNGSTLTSASTTFTWSAATGSSPSYYLWVGTSPGTANLVNIGPLSGTSATVTLPTTGATIYVQLWTISNGGTTVLYNDYSYTEYTAATVTAAAITSPTPGSTLTSTSTTFTWSPATGGTATYYLWVGTSPGTANLVNIGPLSGTSATVTLPTTGAAIYVQLWTIFNGGTTVLYKDYTYTEYTAATVTAAAMTSPTPGSTLTSSSTTFTWSAATGSSPSYYLWVGTSPGTANLVNIGPLAGTSATVTLPTTGAVIYVQLWTIFNGGATVLYNDYSYTEFTVAAAAITSPAPSSTLTGALTTLTWNAGSGGVTGYYLWIGTSPGTANLVNIGPLSGTSATVNLPTNGATIYVQLWTVLNGSSLVSNSYTYTDAN
jgi:hypothetical protein